MAPYIIKTVTMNEKNAMPSATELSADLGAVPYVSKYLSS